MISELILASRSPRRKQILRDMGLRFKAVPADIDEHHNGFRRPHAIAKNIALRKAVAVAAEHPGEWVLGCDTFVVHDDGQIALKPKDKAAARKTLKKYRNSYCDVYSGLALVKFCHSERSRGTYKKFVHFEKTRLKFGNFSDQDIEHYLCSDEWRDSSGSMTIEGEAGEWIKEVKGDYWNVVGLPTELLKEFLVRAGKLN